MAARQRCAVTFVLAAFAAWLPITIEASDAQEGQNQEAPRKYDVEARLMFWAGVGERQSIPDQQESINDFFVRRARVIFQGRPSESITLYFQVGQDDIGGKLLTDDGSIRISRDESSFQARARDYRAWALEAFFDLPLARGAALTVDGAGPGRLQFAFRHEDWDTERGPVDASTSRTTGGATYYLSGHSRKVQADYTRKRETPGISDDEFRVSLVIVF